jgi:hypothetical protein
MYSSKKEQHPNIEIHNLLKGIYEILLANYLLLLLVLNAKFQHGQLLKCLDEITVARLFSFA